MNKMNEATFFWKDKTGRGFSGTLDIANLLEMTEIENDEISIADWAENADIGDEHEDRENKFIRIT